MEHGLELIIPDPGNSWKFDLYNFLISWKYWKSSFFNFLLAWKYWKSVFPIFSYPGNTGGGRTEAGGRLQGLCCAALDYFWNMFPGISGYPGNIGNMVFYSLGLLQKRCAPKFHAGCTDGWAEISHMRPIQARKLKLFQTWISKWRRRRRRPNNSPIWPEPWTITPRDQISRSGSIPHFDHMDRTFHI